MSSGKGRVLVIDDEKYIRTALRRVLEYEGYTVFEAEAGQGQAGGTSSRGVPTSSSGSNEQACSR